MDQQKERNWAIGCQLGGLVYVLFLNIIIPFVIWILKKNESKLIEESGKEIINFEISLTLYGFLLVLASLYVFGWLIAAIVYWVLPATNLACIIISSLKASEGKVFRYPLNLHLIK